MAHILSGQALAEKLLEQVARKARGKSLKLAVIQIGSSPASEKYVNEKRKAAQEAEIEFALFRYRENEDESALKQAIQNIADDPSVQGMIIQLPLPGHLQREELLNIIPSQKDVDVLSSKSFEMFEQDKLPILPPTVHAVSLLLQEAGVDLEGKKVAVVGAGRLVGLPVAAWCRRQGARVHVIQESTESKEQVLRDADIVVSGVGKKNLIKGSMIKKGAVVIDAGTSVETGKTSGDVEFESVEKVASVLTPVPGGVGPLTVACLLYNLVTLGAKQ